MSNLSATDQCVMCGLCLPHCPTYEETRDEGESPRGRIALMQALQAGTLKDNARLALHLERCLGCRACEAMCPSQVPFGALMDQARQVLHNNNVGSKRWLHRVIADGLVSHPERLRVATRLLRFYQRSGLRFLARRSGLLSLLGAQRLDQLLPDLAPVGRWRSYYPAVTAERGQVALFLGCIAQMVDTETHTSAIRILNQFGYGVHIPQGQSCCGALQQHDGRLQAARRLAQTNLIAFQNLEVDAILSTASGCGAQLAEYSRMGFAEPRLAQQAAAFSGRVQDISAFLAGMDWPAGVEFAPLPARVAVHEPCTLRNVLKQGNAPHRLLQCIPEIELLSIADKGDCCGAAGSYFLTQPGMADRLLKHRLDALEKVRPDLVTTANVGCALYLQAGLRQRKLTLEVIHPVVLIDRQLRNPGAD
ncbi:MAG: heterodisulfide reductase-related iron-sulfur binding cluster [Gammaproteobacteria bacterium]